MDDLQYGTDDKCGDSRGAYAAPERAVPIKDNEYPVYLKAVEK